MMSKKAPYKSPKMQILNSKFVIIDLINPQKLLIIFNNYSKTLDDKLIIEDIRASNIWL